MPYHILMFHQIRYMVDDPLIIAFVWCVIIDVATGYIRSAFVRKTNSTKGLFGLVKHTIVLHLRWGARPSASTIAVLPAGSVIKYDAWSRGNDFVYVRQPRGNSYGYVAVRNAKTGEAYGKFE